MNICKKLLFSHSIQLLPCNLDIPQQPYSAQGAGKRILSTSFSPVASTNGKATILYKIFGTKLRNPVNLNKTSKICYLICVFFHSYCQSLISRKKTGHQAASPPEVNISLIFSNFLRSLSRSVTHEATRVSSLLYQISSIVLLVAIRTCAKSIKSTKLL